MIRYDTCITPSPLMIIIIELRLNPLNLRSALLLLLIYHNSSCVVRRLGIHIYVLSGSLCLVPTS